MIGPPTPRGPADGAGRPPRPSRRGSGVSVRHSVRDECGAAPGSVRGPLGGVPGRALIDSATAVSVASVSQKTPLRAEICDKSGPPPRILAATAMLGGPRGAPCKKSAPDVRLPRMGGPGRSRHALGVRVVVVCARARSNPVRQCDGRASAPWLRTVEPPVFQPSLADAHVRPEGTRSALERYPFLGSALRSSSARA